MMPHCCIDWISRHRGESSKLKTRQRYGGVEERERRVSILKSFIVLQKSNYYLTRKKDKWQIIYITNARPAHTLPPHPSHPQIPPSQQPSLSSPPTHPPPSHGTTSPTCSLRSASRTEKQIKTKQITKKQNKIKQNKQTNKQINTKQGLFFFVWILSTVKKFFEPCQPESPDPHLLPNLHLSTQQHTK